MICAYKLITRKLTYTICWERYLKLNVSVVDFLLTRTETLASLIENILSSLMPAQAKRLLRVRQQQIKIILF